MRKIVIDARIIGSSTGVYAENLVNHLQSLDTENQYIILLRKESAWTPSSPNFTTVLAAYKDYSFTEQYKLAKLLYSLRPDLVHFCMPQQPLLYFGKRVTTVHDLTLVRFDNLDMNPLVYKLRKLIFVALLRNVIWRSRAVLTPTEFVRQDVLDFTSKHHSEKVMKTLEAGDPLASAAEPLEVLKGVPYICSINNAFPYKNPQRIVEAFMAVKPSRPDLHLVFAGRKDYFYEQLQAFVDLHGVKDVHILGYISEGEKRWLLQNAQAYVVASLSEGFHITGLEAMYEDCPVISSSASCLPEVYEDSALYFNPNSTRELADAITKLLENPKLRQRLIKDGRAQVKKFSWGRMAEETLAAYRKCLGSGD